MLPDALWPEHIKNLKPTAGPSVTDQIGASVANSANEGMNAIPMFPKRDITGYKNPASFVPDYNDTKGSKSAGDIAEAESKEKGDALNAAKAAEAKAEAEEIAKAKEAADKKAAAILKDKLAEKPDTAAGIEAKAKLVAATNEAAKEKENEKTMSKGAKAEEKKAKIVKENSK